jgi:hypothetical protein
MKVLLPSRPLPHTTSEDSEQKDQRSVLQAADGVPGIKSPARVEIIGDTKLGREIGRHGRISTVVSGNRETASILK